MLAQKLSTLVSSCWVIVLVTSGDGKQAHGQTTGHRHDPQSVGNVQPAWRQGVAHGGMGHVWAARLIHALLFV